MTLLLLVALEQYRSCLCDIGLLPYVVSLLVTDQTGATSSSSGSGSSIANLDCEKGDMAVVKKLIKDVWLHGQGSTFTAKICRCPTDGRLQEFNVSLKQWSPLTDSDRLVSDLSKLLGMIDMGEGAEKPCKAYTPEQRGKQQHEAEQVCTVQTSTCRKAPHLPYTSGMSCLQTLDWHNVRGCVVR